MSLLRNLLLLVPLCVVPPTLSGCAAFTSAMPTVAEVTSDGVAVLGMIEGAVAEWYKAHPTQSTDQAKISAALQATRAALVAGEQTVAGVADISSGEIAGAFGAFGSAYESLMQLLAPLGITSAPDTKDVKAVADGGAPPASPGGITIPRPLVLRTLKAAQRSGVEIPKPLVLRPQQGK